MSDSKSIPTEPRSGKDPPVAVERGEMERGVEGGGKEGDGKEGDANTATQPQTNEPSHPRPTILTQAPSDYHPLSSDQTNANPEAGAGIQPTIQTQPRFESGLDPEPDPEPSPPKDFQGFFVLVDDVKTGISTHPRQIRYLFSDDEDVGGLTGRLLGCLPSSTSAATGTDNKDGNENDRYGGEREGESEVLEGSEDTYRLRRGDKGGDREDSQRREKERTIIIDISPTGDAITSIHSLTSSWQVVNGVIGKAPTFESSNANSNSNSHTGPQHTSGGGADPVSTNPNNTSATHDGTHDHAQGGDGTDGSAALMLRVKGVGKEAFGGEVEGDREERGGREGEMGEDEMRGLLEGFERRLGLLRKVVQGGGGG